MVRIACSEHLYTCACVDPECPVHGVHFVHGVGRSKVVVCPVTGQRRGRDSKSAAEASGAILADAMCAVERRAHAHTHTEAQLSQGHCLQRSISSLCFIQPKKHTKINPKLPNLRNPAALDQLGGGIARQHTHASDSPRTKCKSAATLASPRVCSHL
jgi:hypothetical protein